MKINVSVLGLAMALVGMELACGGAGPVGPVGPPGPGAPGNDQIAGEWHYLSGPMVTGAAIDRINYLELAAEGSGTLFTSSPTGINGCGSVVFAVLSDTTVAATLPDFPDSHRSTVQFYRYARPSPDALALTDAFGNVTSFQRAASVPPSLTCPSAPVANAVSVPANQQPNAVSGLANDGTSLWYSPASGGALPFNPATGTTGTLVNFAGGGQFQWVQAIQGSDFWITCWCGRNSYMQRWSSTGALVSSFDLSAAPTSRDISIEAASYDGSNLWVGGFQYSVQKNMLLKLNANVSPPVVLAAFPFDAQVDGMAFKSGELWILTEYVGPTLVKLDPATGTVRATYALPRGFAYRGLAALHGNLYALRSNSARTTYEVLPIAGL